MFVLVVEMCVLLSQNQKIYADSAVDEKNPIQSITDLIVINLGSSLKFCPVHMEAIQ